MLLPRFSIRTLLLILTLVAVASLFAGQAMGGRIWAVGVTVALASVPVVLLVHALFFAVGSAFANLLGAQEVIARTSRGGVERSVDASARESTSPEGASALAVTNVP